MGLGGLMISGMSARARIWVSAPESTCIYVQVYIPRYAQTPFHMHRHRSLQYMERRQRGREREKERERESVCVCIYLYIYTYVHI